MRTPAVAAALLLAGAAATSGQPAPSMDPGAFCQGSREPQACMTLERVAQESLSNGWHLFSFEQKRTCILRMLAARQYSYFTLLSCLGSDRKDERLAHHDFQGPVTYYYFPEIAFPLSSLEDCQTMAKRMGSGNCVAR